MVKQNDAGQDNDISAKQVVRVVVGGLVVTAGTGALMFSYRLLEAVFF